MGRSPVSDENGILKKGPWSLEEDKQLVDCITEHGHGNWRAIPKLAGLNRCPKSCRLRWINYLRPDIKRGKFSEQEEQLIINLHEHHGNKWSQIASHLEGRTDNEIKNYWNTRLKKKLLRIGIDPITHRKRTDHLDLYANYSQLQANVVQLARAQLLQYLAQVISISSPPSNMEAMSSALLNQYVQSNVEYQHLNASKTYPGFTNLMPRATFSTSQGQPSCSNILPALVSPSPESAIVNQPDCMVNPNHIFTHSSTPTTFETSADYNLEITDNDCYWKDLMDNTTSPPSWA